MTTEKLKTGTTCIGLLFNKGVLLAADRRTTAGYICSDRSTKIYELNKNILATTAGHAADNQLTMRVIKGQLKLLEFKNERSAKVIEAAMILNSVQYSALRKQGSVISLILGGFDKENGFSLYNLGPDGTNVAHDGYVVDGSGSVFIKGLFDNEYNPQITETEALKLVEKAFLTSFKNDNASGGGFICKIVTDSGIKEVKRKIIKTELIDEN
jgi:20S proteasome alpha/beta subunit